ncbi:hypothetical protein [Mycolicibacterium fortuitum]|uniref:hypothetical protein n=1 Tax=Mycolicibacterium fortuitum TaxID=1766 RepID=UPI00262AFCBB|nr:hypothetical protein [Mycolicibacterium fortuitum]
MLETQRLGRDLDNACAVHIADLQNDRGDFIVPVLTEDKWGDRAVVVAAAPCDEGNRRLAHAKAHSDGDCYVLTVAPDESDSLEYVHAEGNMHYAVQVTQ